MRHRLLLWMKNVDNRLKELTKTVAHFANMVEHPVTGEVYQPEDIDPKFLIRPQAPAPCEPASPYCPKNLLDIGSICTDEGCALKRNCLAYKPTDC